MPEFLYHAAPFLLAATFLWILFYHLRNYWFAGESRHWRAVPGKIVLARIVRGYQEDENDRTEEYFEVEVEYRYSVRGKVYVGKRYSYGSDRYSNYDGAMAALHGIAAGRDVPVYYDPARPERAVLRRG